MLSLTPFIDCARRLGHDPAVVLGPIAADGAAWFRTTFETFVQRSDVTLGAFGWSVIETPDGPAYRFAWPRWSRLSDRALDVKGSQPLTDRLEDGGPDRG